ncbi:MAG: ferredoxin--NADP+ reductase [Caulobacteraceae bacterium]|nr:MAG: ferredoxin--NADP+ reductase [Caulobacteraceae bacterium]
MKSPRHRNSPNWFSRLFGAQRPPAEARLAAAPAPLAPRPSPLHHASQQAADPVATPSAYTVERVTSIRHYTDRLFKFRLTRPQAFRFRSGEFVMIGLRKETGAPLLRAYSIASPAWDDELEFYSIKAPNGPLTSRLQHIKPGDEVLIARKPTGTLVLDALTPGKRLFLISTGTGFAPFASLLREPETYSKFEEVVVTHTCRLDAELEYSHEIVKTLPEDPLVGDLARSRVTLYTSCTRDACEHTGRITDLIATGKLFTDLAIAPLDPTRDRVMICGSLAMIQDVHALLSAAGFREGANSAPAEFVIEKAFAG